MPTPIKKLLIKSSLVTTPVIRTSLLLRREGDTTAPTVTITCAQTSPTMTSPLNFTFTFSETVTGFALGDITVGNGTAGNLAGSGAIYTADITPSANGVVTVDIGAGVCQDLAGNNNTAATQFSITYIAFLIRDDFTDTVAAGAVNGTSATPTGGTRTATDGNSKMSIGSDVLSIATGGAAAGNPGLWYAIQAHTAGRAFIAKVKPTTAVIFLGWDGNQAGRVDQHSASFGGSSNITSFAAVVSKNVGTWASGVDYYIAVVLRATGSFVFIKGGTYTNWTLLYVEATGTGNVYPGVTQEVTTGVATVDLVRVPTDTISITPIASDGFGTSESLGNTRGGGSAESGGTGLAYTLTGTWASNGSVAACSALSGGTGIATINASTTNVVAEVIATRSAGTVGLVLRYTDANNYIKVVLDGTNLVVTEIVSGTPNTLGTTAVTYGATKRLIVSLNATKLRAYYGDAFVGAERTTAVTTGNSHGLFTDDTGATFDNFVVWAKGNGNEFSVLDNYVNP